MNDRTPPLRRLVPAVLAAWLVAAGVPAAAQSLRLPVDGRWFVAQGGDSPSVNDHMTAPAQAFGVDLARTGAGAASRSLSHGDGTHLSDWYGWEEPVRAAAAGEVVEATDDLPDNPVGTKDAAHPFGNHVVIRTPESRWVVVAHLRQHSLSVKVGAQVKAGDLLGLCGNSGHSDFPHVHLHVQDRAGLDAPDAHGVNPVFSHMDVELTGARFADVTWPLIRGLFVEPHVAR